LLIIVCFVNPDRFIPVLFCLFPALFLQDKLRLTPNIIAQAKKGCRPLWAFTNRGWLPKTAIRLKSNVPTGIEKNQAPTGIRAETLCNSLYYDA